MTAVKKFFCIVLVLAVLMVRSICRDTDPDLIDDLCKTYGVIPPSEY